MELLGVVVLVGSTSRNWAGSVGNAGSDVGGPGGAAPGGGTSGIGNPSKGTGGLFVLFCYTLNGNGLINSTRFCPVILQLQMLVDLLLVLLVGDLLIFLLIQKRFLMNLILLVVQGQL